METDWEKGKQETSYCYRVDNSSEVGAVPSVSVCAQSPKARATTGTEEVFLEEAGIWLFCHNVLCSLGRVASFGWASVSPREK